MQIKHTVWEKKIVRMKLAVERSTEITSVYHQSTSEAFLTDIWQKLQLTIQEASTQKMNNFKKWSLPIFQKETFLAYTHGWKKGTIAWRKGNIKNVLDNNDIEVSCFSNVSPKKKISTNISNCAQIYQDIKV